MQPSADVGNENETLSFATGFFFVIKTSITLGLLLIHTMFKTEGWIPAIINVTVSSLIGFSIIHLVAANINMLCEKHGKERLKYGEAMQEAFIEIADSLEIAGIVFKHIIHIMLVLNHLILCSMYLVYTISLWSECSTKMDINVFVGLFYIPLILPLILFLCVHSFGKMIFFVIIGVILIAIAIIVTMAFSFLHMFQENGVQYHLINHVTFFFFNYESAIFMAGPIGLFLTIQYNLKEPQQFTGSEGIFVKSAILSSVVHILYGAFLYLSYGTTIRCRVISLFDLVPIGALVNLLISLSIYITYPLHSYIIYDIVWNEYLKNIIPEENRKITLIITGATIIIITVLPTIRYHWIYAGANLAITYSAFLALFCPAIMDLCCKYHSGYGPSFIYLIRDIILIIFSTTSFIIPYFSYGYMVEDCFIANVHNSTQFLG
ncbi:glutamate transporter polyphemus-like [Teleopsis dalmanni]|uniref:glutamate transporter polyphemus-like n=1 Tax=Teleopsis dalmanni TaxID=139649 RepID=UPI0018CE59D1|nr:glutamate transporter polyphemus-like [Teleopsis dalmanni]